MEGLNNKKQLLYLRKVCNSVDCGSELVFDCIESNVDVVTPSTKILCFSASVVLGSTGLTGLPI